MARRKKDPTPDTQDPVEITEDQAVADALKFNSASLTAIKAREDEFEKGWWKHANVAEKIYTADNSDNEANVPYNILYSNTEVLLPSLYSAVPKPDIRARYKDQNLAPLPDIVERFLVCATETSPGGDSFDNAMKDAVLSSLVPGMGYVRIRYPENSSFPITYESGNYRSLIWGKATRWSKVPWIAFKSYMKRDQMFELFDIKEPAEQEKYVPTAEAEGDKNNAVIYELWDKKTRKVYFLCDQWQDKLLQESDDPLGLENFFPTPGPLLLTMRPGKYLPIPLYNFYSEQANELNRVSVRLIKVLSAIRVRGVYNGLLGDDLKKILEADAMDNELVAATEAALLAQSGGFEKHIWLLPLEMLITTARELYTARESIKNIIYELTGISDIIRGASVAEETALAQSLKNKWGTVRLRRMQSVVADYTRDLFRMTIDCASDHVPIPEWQEIVQMPAIPTSAEQTAAKQKIIQIQAEARQMLMSQPPPPPGSPPPPPPPIPPELQQAAASPTWEMLLDKIKNDAQRTFIVNIQTSSTIDLDTAQDKADVSEFMNALGQLLPGLQGLSQLGPSGLEAAKGILIAVCERYKFGIDIAPVIQAIQPPPPPPPDPKIAEQQTQLQQQAMQQQQALQQKQVADQQSFAAQQAQLNDQRNELELDKKRNLLELEKAAVQKAAEVAEVQRDQDLKIQNARLEMKDLIRQIKADQKVADAMIEAKLAAHGLEVDRANDKAKNDRSDTNLNGLSQVLNKLNQTLSKKDGK